MIGAPWPHRRTLTPECPGSTRSCPPASRPSGARARSRRACGSSARRAMRSCTAPSWSATCMCVPSAAITCAWGRASGWSAFSMRARARKSAPPSRRRIRSSSATASATATGSPRRRKRPARVMPWWCSPARCTRCRSWPAPSNSSSSAARWARWSASASSAAWITASRSGGRSCASPPAAGRACRRRCIRFSRWRRPRRRCHAWRRRTCRSFPCSPTRPPAACRRVWRSSVTSISPSRAP